MRDPPLIPPHQADPHVAELYAEHDWAALANADQLGRLTNDKLKARARARAGKGRGGWGGPRRRLAHRVRAAACSQTSKPCAPPYPLSQVYLKRNKLALGGKKQELIDRIKEHVLSGIA